MTNKLRKILFTKKQGLNLVEVVVAIGVSIVTLTTSAVFSTRLIIRAQENFMVDSSTQLVTLLTEQFRLIEADMQNTKKTVGNDTTTYPSTLKNRQTWNDICASEKSEVYLKTDIPIVGSENQSNINLVTQETKNDIKTPYGKYQFNYISKDSQTGAFYIAKDSNIGISIKRTITEDGVSALGPVLNFSIITSYSVPNLAETRFSTPVQIKMFKSSVCP